MTLEVGSRWRNFPGARPVKVLAIETSHVLIEEEDRPHAYGGWNRRWVPRCHFDDVVPEDAFLPEEKT